MGSQSSNKKYWCHTCQGEFLSHQQPGVDDVVCPKCSNDFCEIYMRKNRPDKFEPYQKPPKSNPRRIPKLTSQIVMMALAQLTEDSYIQKVREIRPEDVGHLRVNMSKEGEECLICQ